MDISCEIAEGNSWEFIKTIVSIVDPSNIGDDDDYELFLWYDKQAKEVFPY